MITVTQNKARLAYSLFFVLWSLAAIGQKNYQPGFVILNSGDTLSGFIDQKEWHRNPVEVLFTPDRERNNARIYKVGEISYFEIAGQDSYQRYSVSISMDTRDMSDLEEKNVAIRNETVFLKVVYIGKNISLFNYEDNLKLRWYVKQDNEDTPQELIYRIYRVRGQIVNEREYRMQLQKISSRYLPANQEVKKMINKATYGKEMLTIAYQINGVDQDQIAERKKVDNASRLGYFVGSGISQGSMDFIGKDFTDDTSSPSYFPILTGGVDLFLAPQVGRLYLRNSLTLNVTKGEIATNVEVFNPDLENFVSREWTEYKITQVNITIHSQLHFNVYNKPNFKWFVGAGGGFNISAYPENEEKFIVEGYNARVVESDGQPIQNFWLNASARSGFAIKRGEVSLNYFSRTAITDLIGTSSTVKSSSIQLQFIYLFRRKI